MLTRNIFRFTLFVALIIILSGCSKKPKLLSIETEVAYYSDVNGQQRLPTDVFPMNKNIYVFVTINTVNNSQKSEQVSLSVTIPKSKGIEVRQSSGPISVNINNIEGISGSFSTIISGINYLAEEGTYSQKYVFKIQGIENGIANMTFNYEGNIKQNNKSFFVQFQFVENLEIEQLIMPTYEIQDTTIQWSHAIAESYIFKLIYLGTVIIDNPSFNQTNYDISTLDAGIYTIELIAKGNGIEYRDSMPRVIDFIILDKSTISLEVGKITWTAVSGAMEYEIKLNGSVIGNTAELYLEVNDLILIPGVNEFVITAKSNDLHVIDSIKFATTSIIKLYTPTISNSGSRIVWAAIPNAVSYDIYVDNVFYANTTELYFVKLSGGEFTVKIAAKGNQSFTYDSDFSNSITYQLG